MHRPHHASCRRRRPKIGIGRVVALGALLAVSLLVDPVGGVRAAPLSGIAGASAAPVTATTPAGPDGGSLPCVLAACPVPSPTGAGPSPALRLRPLPSLLGNTPTNWLVANWSGEGMIAENPSNPASFVAGSLYQEPGSLNNSTIYNAQGVSGAYASSDGGHSWFVQPLPACEFHIADSALAFGPGGHVVYIDMGWGTSAAGCPWSGVSGYGVFATTSDNGGYTWGTPVSLRGNGSFSLDKPWVTVDPVSGEYYAAYTDDGASSQIYLQNSTDNGSTWSTPIRLSTTLADSMRGVELSVDATGAVDAVWVDQSTATVEFTRSTDHGAKFSTPVALGTAATAYSSPSPDGFRAYLLPALAVDRSPTSADEGRIYAAWQNGTGGSAGSPFISEVYSTDNGTHWTAPKKVNSDTLYEDFQPSIAVDPNGTVFIDWYAESATSGHYRLQASESHNGGATFDPEVNVSDTDSYPYYTGLGNAWWIGDYTDIVADAQGAHPLWTDARGTQEWSCTNCLWGYDYNISMYTAEIVNFSVTANVPVNLTLGGSVPGAGTWPVGPGGAYGDWLVGQNYTLTAPAVTTVNGTNAYFTTWYGAASSSSTSLTGSVTGDAALHACYTFRANDVCRAPGAPGFLEISGAPAGAAVRVNGQPAALFAGAANLTERPGPYWVNASAPGFHSRDTEVNVTTANVSRVNATLTPYPGWIAGSVLPAASGLEVDGVPVVVAANGTFNVSVLPGTHTISAFYPLYANFTDPALNVVTNVTTPLLIDLAANAGVVHGSVFPPDAAVTVNGQAVPTPGGIFDIVLPIGTYWFNATAASYLPGSSGPVVVLGLSNTSVDLTLLLAAGTLAGTVAPASATLRVDGTVVPLSGDAYNVTLSPGPHDANVSAPGYAPEGFVATVSPEATTWLNFSLSAVPGWIVGQVSPAGATVRVGDSLVSLAANGAFNVSLMAGTYRLSAGATGYAPVYRNVTVAAGVAVETNLTLSPLPAVTASGLTTTDLAGLGIVAVGAVAVAVGVLLLRARRGRRASPASRPPSRPPPRSPRPPGPSGR